MGISIFILAGIDLGSKWIVTQYLQINLDYKQRQDLLIQESVSLHPGLEQISLVGNGGKILRFKLYFNDRFAFSTGPRLQNYGIYIAIASMLFLFLLFFLFKEYSRGKIHFYAWILILSGSISNMIDRLYLVSFVDRTWFFSLKPVLGKISGVIDFIDMAWFGWGGFHNIPVLEMLTYKRWPVYNIADVYLFLGILLLITGYKDLIANLIFGIFRKPVL